MTLPYQSCVLKRNVWRLRICGPPTQGWVSIFIASFGGDRQHGTGDGGQNVGADGKTRRFAASLSFIVTGVTHISQKRRGFRSTAGTGWSGLLGEVEEKGGGHQKSEGGPEIIVNSAESASYGDGHIGKQALYVEMKRRLCALRCLN